MMALMIVPMVAIIGVSTEAAGWFSTQRAMQHAADAAAIAAATNGCDPSATCHTTGLSPTYVEEARAVTSQLGFQNGVNATAVTASDTAPCPNGGSNCYSVTISRPSVIGLLKVTGFQGDTTTGGARAQTVASNAVASPKGPPTSYCIIALAHGLPTSSNAITLNGGGSIDLGGCSIFSNASEKCDGSNGSNNYYDILYGNSVGPVSNSNCGAISNGNLSPIADPYSSLKSNIPSNSCSSYPGKTLTPASANMSANGSGNPFVVCGNLTLSSNIALTTASPGTVIVINNGSLNLNGFKLSAPVGSGLTIVFSGSAGQTPGFPTGSGTLDFGAPKSGVWSGVALYQNPSLTKATSPTYTGNTPAFDITGLIYLPYANLTIKGAINHQTAGLSCLGIVADQLTVSGGGWIFANTTRDCATAGLTIPAVPNSGARSVLVG